MFGLRNDNGELVSRFVDLFWMWSNASALLLDGASIWALVDRLPIFLAGACWLVMAWWIGRPIILRTQISASRLELTAAATLFGLAILSTSTLLLGLTGLLGSRLPLLASVSLLMAASALDNWRGTQTWPETTEIANSPAAQNIFTAWAVRFVPILGIGFAVFYCLGSVLPPWEFDVLEYHLQAPKEFFQAGKISFVDHNIYANMPLGSEMHSLAAMVIIGGQDGWWWGGMVGKFVIGSHTLLAAMLVLGFASRKFGSWIGWASAGLLLSAPGCMYVSPSGLVDMALGAYLLAATWSVSHLYPTATCAKQPFWFCLFATFTFAGGAAACKYTGLVCCVIPITLFIFINELWLRKPASQKVEGRVLAILSSSALAICITVLPWYAKNTVMTGNPVYPLAGSVFGFDSADANERWQAAHQPGGPTSSKPYSPTELLASGEELIFKSRHLNPSLYFFAACGLLAACVGWPKNRLLLDTRTEALTWLAVCIWILATWWLLTHRIDRFWLPILPLVSLLASGGIRAIADRASTGVAIGFVVLGLGWGALVGASGGAGNDVRIFTPLADFRSNLSDPNAPAIVAESIAWCNARFSSNAALTGTDQAKLLLIGQAAAYQFQIPIEYSTCFDLSLAEQLLRDEPLATQRASLLEHGITHIVIDWVEINRYRAPGNYGFSDWPTPETLESWIQSGLVRKMATPFEDYEFQVLEVATSTANQAAISSE